MTVTVPDYSVAVDIGGTFTDCVLVDPDGEVIIGKSPTVRQNPAEGVLNAVDVAASQIELGREELLSRLSLFVHGNTIGTNALIERTGARVGLVTTLGHEDNLLIGRVYSKRAGLSEREIIHTSKLKKPDPIVPRSRILGVAERVDWEGDVIVALDEAAVIAAVEALVADGIEALAVAFLWSFRNPAHEQRVRDIVAERWPDLPVTISSDVAPVIGEYERTVTTVLNAYLQPRVGAYLRDLEGRLEDGGFPHELMVIQSGGGIARIEQVARRAVLTIDSGPAGGTLGSRFFGAQVGEPNVICTDVGGTSFDVSLVHGGEFQLESAPIIGQYTYRAPKILIKSIGAGGGSLVWLDELGGLHVGPDSAGADPGPACYGRGTRPTVTDADLILGYLNPDNFLGGRMQLDVERATEAMAPIAESLGKSIEDAAYGVYDITNAHMADLIRTMSIEQGYDPRDFVVVAFGGAGAAHAVGYTADIGAEGLYVPREATVFSALGMLMADTIHAAESSLPLTAPLDAEQYGAVNSLFASLTDEVLATFREQGIDAADVELRRNIFMRYATQVHELAVEVEARDLTVDDETLLGDLFQQRYTEIYGEGAAFTEAGRELLTFRVEGISGSDKPAFVAGGSGAVAPRPSSGPQTGTRDMYFGPERGELESAVLGGALLRSGDEFAGPAVVERYGDAVVVPPGYVARVDEWDNIVISSEGGGA